MEQLAESLVLQEVVFCKTKVSVVDGKRFWTKSRIYVEQSLKRLFPCELLVELAEKPFALAQRFL